MKREPYDWYIKGCYDWSIRNWSPPTDPEAFKNYAYGWDYIFSEDGLDLLF